MPNYTNDKDRDNVPEEESSILSFLTSFLISTEELSDLPEDDDYTDMDLDLQNYVERESCQMMMGFGEGLCLAPRVHAW